MRQLATGRPVLFGLLVIVLIPLFYIVAGVLAEIGAADRSGAEITAAVFQTAGAFLFLWAKRSGHPYAGGDSLPRVGSLCFPTPVGGF